MPTPDHKRRLVTFVVAMAVLVAAPLAVVASDAFTDVADSNVHHDDITWLADNGVTLGCNPPDNDEFCPEDPVLRQQMASFMRRLAENQIVDADTAVTAQTAGDADTVDGEDASAFLGTDAAVVHRQSVSPTELWHDADATESTGFGPNWGLEMPDANTPAFAYSFSLPDTYEAGDPIRIIVLGWMESDTSCNVSLTPNSVSFARVGMVPTTDGASASAGLSPESGSNLFPMPATESEATTKTYLLDWSEVPEPGDNLAFSLFRAAANADDDCTGIFHVGGLELVWG